MLGAASGCVDPHLEVDLRAGPPGLLDQAWDVRQARLWRRRRRAPAPAPPGAPRSRPAAPRAPGAPSSAAAQRVSRTFRAAGRAGPPAHPRAAPSARCGGRARRASRGRCGCARPCAHASACTTLLRLGAQGTLAQREEELTPGADEHAPRDRGEHEAAPSAAPPTRDWSPGCRSAKTRADGTHSAAASRTGRRLRCTASEDSASSPAAVAEIENAPNRTQTSATPSGQRRRHHSERQAKRPARDVDDHLPEVVTAWRCRPALAQEERPERGGEEEPDGVDCPVAAVLGPAVSGWAGSTRCQQRGRHQLVEPSPAPPVHDPSVEAPVRARDTDESRCDRDERRYPPGSRPALPTSDRGPPGDARGPAAPPGSTT